MQSKLKSFTAKMKNGQHDTFSTNYGQMWVFDVTFEDGTRGEANSTKQVPNWNAGKEYEYTATSKQFDWGTVNKIKMKQVEQEAAPKGGRTGYSGKMTPEKQKEIMCQVSMIAANSIMNKLEEDYDTIVRNFLSFLIINAKHHDPISLQGALKIAAEYYSNVDPNDDEPLLAAEGILSIELVLNRAKSNINKTEKSRTWNGALETSTKESLEENPPSHMNDQLDQPEKTNPFLNL